LHRMSDLERVAAALKERRPVQLEARERQAAVALLLRAYPETAITCECS
jgi:hypothetical protein